MSARSTSSRRRPQENVQLCRQGIEAFRRIFTPTHPRPDPSLPSSTPSLPEGVGAVDGTPRRLVETALERCSARVRRRTRRRREKARRDRRGPRDGHGIAGAYPDGGERSWLRSKAQAAVDAAKGEGGERASDDFAKSRDAPDGDDDFARGATLPSPRRRVLSDSIPVVPRASDLPTARGFRLCPREGFRLCPRRRRRPRDRRGYPRRGSSRRGSNRRRTDPEMPI